MGEGDGKGKERRCSTSPVRASSDGTGAIGVPSLDHAIRLPSPPQPLTFKYFNPQLTPNL